MCVLQMLSLTKSNRNGVKPQRKLTSRRLASSNLLFIQNIEGKELFKNIFLLVLVFMSLAVNAASVDSWLDKMGQSMMQQSYKGTLIIRQGDELQAIKVTQGINGADSWQTMESQTGENHIIFRKNAEVTTIYPAKKLITISAAMDNKSVKDPLHALPKNKEKLKQLYLFELGSEERVANKTTQVIHMTPRDKYRYGYTFWLDKSSGLLLKCDLKNNKGKVLEQFMYSDIELLSSAPKNNIEPSKLAAFKRIRLSNKTDVDAERWHANNIPNGFDLIRSVKTAQTPPAYHMVFSDGMASVSVFIESTNKNQKKHIGQSNMGLVNVYSAFVDNQYITAIGEVPASTVRMIAQSVHAAH